MTLAKMRRSLVGRAGRQRFAFHDLWYVDDGIVAVSSGREGDFERALREEGEKVGCSLKLFTRRPTDHLRVPLGENRTSGRVGQCTGLIRRVTEVVAGEAPEAALGLLRVCAGPAVRLRTLARCRRDVDWEEVDDALRKAVAEIVGGSEGLSEAERAQTQLPVRAGGLGLPSMAEFAEAFHDDAAAAREEWMRKVCQEIREVLGMRAPSAEEAGVPRSPAVRAVEQRLREVWHAAARAQGPGAEVHAMDVEDEWTGDWLLAERTGTPPIPPEAFRRALRLRLWMAVSTPGSQVACSRCHRVQEADGRHLVGCAPLRATRHNAVRKVIREDI